LRRGDDQWLDAADHSDGAPGGAMPRPASAAVPPLSCEIVGPMCHGCSVS
jgi:hypothetical protein